MQTRPARHFLFARVGHPESGECSLPFVLQPLFRRPSVLHWCAHYTIYFSCHFYELRSPSRTSPGNSSSRTVFLILIILSTGKRSNRELYANRHNDAPETMPPDFAVITNRCPRHFSFVQSPATRVLAQTFWWSLLPLLPIDTTVLDPHRTSPCAEHARFKHLKIIVPSYQCDQLNNFRDPIFSYLSSLSDIQQVVLLRK